MRRLLLLRHAKSSWADPKHEDFERPLNSRGISGAKAVAAHFSATKLKPDLVLCSAALRARATLAELMPALARDTRISVERRLYMASAPRLLEAVRDTDDAVRTLLLIGHNPGLENLARLLAGSGPDEMLSAMAAKFPTAALAVFDFDADRWRDIGKGTGTLAEFTIPRDLED
jgi:phosphohistidine phosphatase